ncbi:MAG TPA: succinate dehydrogenase, hydrophobic membrane anchor protein [Gammaproteobacteria bacterium]|jgi:succinate dehydrogenase / fumarate reductase membrane anchor subunit|nr:succinate dehydrogenase, hydrophobic membrane anchor protein [Gammaproteobacteria bacterium]
MVKSVLGVNHQGLRDWAVQRLSAIIIAIYAIGLIAYIVCHPGLTFFVWRELFAHTWMKIATILFIAALLCHAWVGMWTIFTDYIKCNLLRGLCHVVVLLMLVACFIWGTLILWSV